MGVTPDELAAVYPRLYHMADAQSWEGIRKHGLLSTSALLDLFGKNGEERTQIESCRRAETVAIEDSEHGHAIVRDQKPLVESKLAKSLSGCTLEEWYRLLNKQKLPKSIWCMDLRKGKDFNWRGSNKRMRTKCAKAARLYRRFEQTAEAD